MRKKSNAPLKPALKCELCEGILKLKKVIPAAHIFPELRTYACVECGALRSVEDEAELVHRGIKEKLTIGQLEQLARGETEGTEKSDEAPAAP